MSQQQIDEAAAKGFSLVRASPFEVGLLRNGRGCRTWWAGEFGCKMPKLDHAAVQEAIRTTEDYEIQYKTP